MVKYNTWEELIEKSEQNMQHLEEDRDYSFAIYDIIKQKVNSCLASCSYSALLDLCPYFEAPENYPRFHHSSETYRIYILLRALKLELKHKCQPFFSCAGNYEELLARYLQTVFALRRLELAFSLESMEEAVAFLHSIPFNIYVAHALIYNELFENYEKLYWNLYHAMKSFWPIEDNIALLLFLWNEVSSTKALLELSSLYMEIQCYDKAYEYLRLIPSPSPEVTALIQSLKEILHDE